jgi:hypothetical protein
MNNIPILYELSNVSFDVLVSLSVNASAFSAA